VGTTVKSSESPELSALIQSTTQSCDRRHGAPLYGGEFRMKETRKQREGLTKNRILKRERLDDTIRFNEACAANR
jgi:hypothetical protein